ncbi:hypothetical protein HWV62_22028 [Athelia sp. TMB]|nr:hypothetical protein HWV62_22028 [Athelia sp. TMB]
MSYDNERFNPADLKCNQLDREKSFHVEISLDDQKIFLTSILKGGSELSWDDKYIFEASVLSNIQFKLLKHHKIWKTEEVGQAKVVLQHLVRGSSNGMASCMMSMFTSEHPPRLDISLALWNGKNSSVPPRLFAPSLSFRLSTLSKDANIVRLHEEEAIQQGRGRLDQMVLSPFAGANVETVSNAGVNMLNSAKTVGEIWASVVEKLQVFAKIANELSALIIAQQRRDGSIIRLMETIDDAHSFLSDAEPSETVRTHPELFNSLSSLTAEGAYLIRDYAMDKYFWKRILHLEQAGLVDDKIQEYDDKFKEIKLKLRERAIFQIDIMLLRCLDHTQTIQSALNEVQNAARTLIINNLPYAEGAGFDPDKTCIPGTRKFVLSKLHNWINERDGDDVPRLMVLTGDPGLGKSAIAHTLAVHYHEMKRLGSFVSFSRADQQRRNPRNLLSTISRGIADLDPLWRAALHDLVNKDLALAKSTSPSMQMKSILLEPAKSLRIAGPVVIIIDALDESGDAQARESLLRVLSQNASALPCNFRVLVTTRPEQDITRAFSGKRAHIEQLGLETMVQADTDLRMDIEKFIEHRLDPITGALDAKWLSRERWLSTLVNKSGYVFQWAATTCRAILEIDEEGVHQLVDEILEAGGGLDDLYSLILGRKFAEGDSEGMHRFKRVMGRILMAKEPLSKSTFKGLFRDGNETEDFDTVLSRLGSLLSGISDDGPIKARHATFFDFLTDKGRSNAYFIDRTHYYEDFTWSCVRTLNSRLSFNICELQTSYTANTEMPHLVDRVAERVGPALTYASRFLSQYLDQTLYSEKISIGLRALLQEHLLYWLEVISLLKQMGTASKVFASIHAWVQTHDADRAAFAKDVIQFVETFATPVSQSVAHIYLSALPFAPSQSLVSQTYLPQYPSTARLKVGKLDWWPVILKIFEDHVDAVWAVAYSPNGKRIASASADRTIRVWDTETGEAVGAPIKGHTAAIRSIAFSLSGDHIVSGSEDGTVRMWESETGESVRSPLKHGGIVDCISYSPDGKHIVSGSSDDTLRMRDAETGEATETLIKGTFFAYSPEGSHIVSVRGATLSIWDVGTGGAVGAPLEGHSGKINCVVYSPDGTLIASCSMDNTIRLWNVETRQAVGVLEGHIDAVVPVAFSPDGAHLVSGSYDKTIRVWDVKARKPAGAPLIGHASAVLSVAYSPDGRHIVSGSDDGTVRVWDAEAAVFEPARAALEGSSSSFFSMAYSPGGASIVSGSREGKIQIWDVNTGQPMPIPISGHCQTIDAISYSPDGAFIISGCSDGTMQVWDALTGKAVGAPLVGHTQKVLSVAYSPDGSHIVSGSFDGTVRTWDVNSGSPLGDPFKQRRVWAVAYSPDGMHVVSGGEDNILRIWSIKTSEQVRALSGHTDSVTCVAYSPDGTRIVSGSWDKTICLWNAKSGESIGSPLLGHDEMIESVAFSSDGKNIVSCSRDQTVRMWDAESREPVGAPIKLHSDYVVSVAYSPDGTRIASASQDNTIRIWEVAKMEASANSDGSAKFKHDCKLENGWIVTASGQLLLWLPPWNRQGLVWPSNVAVVAPSVTELDLADFVHGSDWVSCKADAKVVAAGL